MTRIALFQYQVPFREPIVLGGQSHSFRRGILLNDLTTGDWSEAAPLPGFSRESLTETRAAARRQHWDHCPSLEFGFHSLNLPFRRDPIPVNALLLGSREQVLRQADKVAREPFETVKLKVGRAEALEHDIALVRHVRQRLRNDQKLRLDANRGWSRHEAADFGRSIQDLTIEYLEEPCQDPRDFESFYNETGIRYALDESLCELDVISRLESYPNAAAYVVKPTLLGSAHVDMLRSQSTPCVFSACFESGVGILKIAAAANQVDRVQPAGLDTYRWLGHDVLRSPLTFANGNLIPPTVTTPQLNRSRLTEILND